MSATELAGSQASRTTAKRALRRAGHLQSRFPALQVTALILIILYGVTTIPGYGSASSLKAMAVWLRCWAWPRCRRRWLRWWVGSTSHQSQASSLPAV